MQTPDQSHIPKIDFDHVYEPSEDSFLLIDALECDLKKIQHLKPTLCLEVGSGSGVVITALGMAIPNCFYLATDINFKACLMTRSTAKHNNVVLDCVSMDLLTSFIDFKFDIIVFNPPYVVTDSEECLKHDITASWAGGMNGREVIDRLLPLVHNKLVMGGLFYMLVIEENIPVEIIEIMKSYNFVVETVIERKARNEKQKILKFCKVKL